MPILGIIFSGFVGSVLWAIRGPILILLAIGSVLAVLNAIYNLPGKIAAMNHVEVQYEPVQVTRYEWKVAYRITNTTPDYRVNSLSFSCDGGKTEVASGLEIEPGHDYVGALSVPFAERISECRAHYSVEHI